MTPHFNIIKILSYINANSTKNKFVNPSKYSRGNVGYCRDEIRNSTV